MTNLLFAVLLHSFAVPALAAIGCPEGFERIDACRCAKLREAGQLSIEFGGGQEGEPDLSTAIPATNAPESCAKKTAEPPPIPAAPMSAAALPSAPLSPMTGSPQPLMAPIAPSLPPSSPAPPPSAAKTKPNAKTGAVVISRGTLTTTTHLRPHSPQNAPPTKKEALTQACEKGQLCCSAGVLKMEIPPVTAGNMAYCSAHFPATRAGSGSVRRFRKHSAAMLPTGPDCKLGNIPGAHIHTVTGVDFGSCENYCTMWAECDSSGNWVNFGYTW